MADLGDLGQAQLARTPIVPEGLELLPLPAREQVVRFAAEATTWPSTDVEERGEARAAGNAALRALPVLSSGTLAALQELRLPIGRLRAATVGEATGLRPRRARS